MDRYVRVEQAKTEQSSIIDNEVRIMAAGQVRNYITYATSLLTEKGHVAVTLKGMGRAINKTVTVAEIIKRRIPNLHQLTEIGSVNITDTWEPLEEGLNTLETTRHVSVISITLSTVELDTSKPGYQQPLPEEQVRPLQEGPPRRTRAPVGSQLRGRGRGQGMGRGRGLDPGASGSADIAAQLSDTHLNPPIPQPANTETPAYGLAPSFVGSSSQQ